MNVTAKLSNLRMSPRKLRLVVDVVRKMETGKALDQLKFINKKACKPVLKLVKSAIANAEHNFNLDKNNLFIKEISVDQGATMKRWMPKAHGRATPIRKKSSHINLTLSEIKDSGKKESKKQIIDAPIKLGSVPKEEVKVKVDKKVKDDKIKDSKSAQEEKGKEIVDPRMEGKGKHTKIEGSSSKGFIGKMFRRKSG